MGEGQMGGGWGGWEWGKRPEEPLDEKAVEGSRGLTWFGLAGGVPDTESVWDD